MQNSFQIQSYDDRVSDQIIFGETRDLLTIFLALNYIKFLS